MKSSVFLPGWVELAFSALLHETFRVDAGLRLQRKEEGLLLILASPTGLVLFSMRC